MYCQWVSRSALNILKLHSNSFVEVYDFEGGFSKFLSECRTVEILFCYPHSGVGYAPTFVSASKVATATFLSS